MYELAKEVRDVDIRDWGLINEEAIEVFCDEDLAALIEGIDENGVAQ